jgi:hypothetical protein
VPFLTHAETSEPSFLDSSYVTPSAQDFTDNSIFSSPSITPTAPPSTPQLSKSPTPVPDDDYTGTMTENIPKFWGDDEHEDENPQDFINSIEILFVQRPSFTDTQKLKTFQLYLKSGSIAKQWWNGLATTDNDTWDHLASAFAKRWPEKTPTLKTVEEKQAALERAKITEDEVGTRVKIQGVEEFTHVVWADKIEKLAAAIPDTNGLLIGNIRKAMPKSLQKVVGSGHRNWTSFCKAVRTATLTEIEEAKTEEKEAQSLRDEVKKLQSLQTTKSITAAFQGLGINNMAQNARFPGPQARQTSTNNIFATQTAPTVPNQPAYGRDRPPAARMEDVIRLALAIQPDTPAGRTAYATQIAEWNTNNPRQFVNELRPYPLSPGTSPVASGECWKCGRMGHRGPTCSATDQIPALEQRWRAIAATISRENNTATAESVNYVSTNDTWLSREEYDQQVIANFLMNQGKGQGSST